MTKVNINGTNHQVEIDHDGNDLSYVVDKAKALWEQTKPADAGKGPAFGYSTQVAHQQAGYASFNHNEQPVVDR